MEVQATEPIDETVNEGPIAPGTDIVMPFNYVPRGYQEPARWFLYEGIKRGVAVWHRRAGKEKTFLNVMAEQMCLRVGLYYYLFPEKAQGKKILWEGRDREGFAFMDHFPEALVKRRNNTDLLVELKAPLKSTFQIAGTDDWDSLMGTNPVGMIFSEYALQDPAVWDYFRPILAENGGWAIFDYTPRGKNHGYKLAEMAKKNPKWFFSLLTVNDTKRPDGTPVITPEAIQEDRDSGMSQEMIQQEYYCSFEGSIEGSYYAREMAQAERDGRIGRVPHDSAVCVDTYWDLGIDDSMSIWFIQRVGRACQAIDYYENSGEGFTFYKNILDDRRRDCGYSYGEHVMPHDIMARDLSGEGKTRKAIAESLGISPIVAVPKLGLLDGIASTRAVISSCWFDAVKCEPGIDALKSYCKEWDNKLKVFKKKPLHNWASHGADSFRTFAVGRKGISPKVITHRDVLSVAPAMG
ncbi:MAG: hypothetical protein KAJ07_00435 [Planctomycetes bacterium]|nr:hypothetical protein [Planctomycetota bacterium]